MPKEERYITFSMDEVLKAIKIKSLQEDRAMPPDEELLGVVIDGSGNQECARFKFSNSSVDYERRFFGEALVFYCQGFGIPLPRGGEKVLKALEHGVVMKITI